MKEKLPSSARDWLTFIIRLIFEIGIAWNLYNILPDTIRLVSSLTSPIVQSYIEPITLILIISYLAWRVFGPNWKRDDIFSITVGYVITSIPFVFLHDAIFNRDYMRLGIGLVLFVLGIAVVCGRDADFKSWRSDHHPGHWAKRLVDLICKLWLEFMVIGIAWKIIFGLQFVTYIPIFGTDFPPLDISGIRLFYEPIMLAISLSVLYYTINNGNWFTKASVPKIVTTIILSMAAAVVLTMPDHVLTAAVLNVLSGVLAVVIGIIVVCIIGAIGMAEG